MNKKKKITITLSEDTIELLEKRCKQSGLTKSEYINKIITSTSSSGRKEKLTILQKEDILNKHKLGVSISRIAREYEISRNLVYKIIEENR